MFLRLGLCVLLLAAMPALVLAGSAYSGDPQYDEFGNKIESKNDDAEEQESETEPPPPEPVYPKMFDATFGGGFGYGFTTGDFYSGLDSALLYFGEFRLALSPKIYIKLGYRKINIYNDVQSVSDVDGTYLGTFDLSADVHAYLFSLGWLSSPNENTNLRIYGEFGGGYGNHVVTASMGSLSLSDDTGKFMLLGQIGVILPINKSRVGLDLGGSILNKSFSGGDNEGWGAIFSVHVGLVIIAGGG
jgi:hypothetical protein